MNAQEHMDAGERLLDEACLSTENGDLWRRVTLAQGHFSAAQAASAMATQSQLVVLAEGGTQAIQTAAEAKE